jgi:NAD/NADP transhydrogenase beta subunit
MIVIGCVLVPFSAIYEFKLAKYPVLAPRFALNRSVVIACAIGAFDFVGSIIRFLIVQLTLAAPDFLLHLIHLSILLRHCCKILVNRAILHVFLALILSSIGPLSMIPTSARLRRWPLLSLVLRPESPCASSIVQSLS